MHSAAEVVFQFCVPAHPLVLEGVTMDWRESIELPNNLGGDAMCIFEGLGLSFQDYSSLDFIRGHLPPSLLSGHEIILNCVVDGDETTGSPSLSTCSVKLKDSSVSDDFYSLTRDKTISDASSLTLQYVLHALESLSKEVVNRVRLMKLRLMCFYILLHSRVSSGHIQPYLAPGSALVNDLVAFADLSSEIHSTLDDCGPYTISLLSMRNLVGLVDASLHRRSSLRQTDILSRLGLRGAHIDHDRSDSDMVWSIFSSSMSTGLIVVR